jgi:lysine biosynthesis protein LysW
MKSLLVINWFQLGRKESKMLMTFCLDCEREIDLEARLIVGQRITCPHCGVELEVINLEPLELDWVYDGSVISFNLWAAGQGLP